MLEVSASAVPSAQGNGPLRKDPYAAGSALDDDGGSTRQAYHPTRPPSSKLRWPPARILVTSLARDVNLLRQRDHGAGTIIGNVAAGGRSHGQPLDMQQPKESPCVSSGDGRVATYFLRARKDAAEPRPRRATSIGPTGCGCCCDIHVSDGRVPGCAADFIDRATAECAGRAVSRLPDHVPRPCRAQHSTRCRSCSSTDAGTSAGQLAVPDDVSTLEAADRLLRRARRGSTTGGRTRMPR